MSIWQQKSLTHRLHTLFQKARAFAVRRTGHTFEKKQTYFYSLPQKKSIFDIFKKEIHTLGMFDKTLAHPSQWFRKKDASPVRWDGVFHFHPHEFPKFRAGHHFAWGKKHTINVPSFTLPKIVLPKLTMPRVVLPKFSAPKIILPKLALPKLTMPKALQREVRLPKFALPKISAPKLPQIKLPTMTAPKLEIPKFTFPKIAFPPVALPKLTLPKISLPKFTAPNITPPKLAMPKILQKEFHLPRVSAPKLVMPRFTAPKVLRKEIHLPKLTIPKITLPKLAMPKILQKKIHLPKLAAPKFPTLKFPTPTLPKLTMPRVVLPKFSAPKIILPKLPPLRTEIYLPKPKLPPLHVLQKDLAPPVLPILKKAWSASIGITIALFAILLLPFRIISSILYIGLQISFDLCVDIKDAFFALLTQTANIARMTGNVLSSMRTLPVSFIKKTESLVSHITASFTSAIHGISSALIISIREDISNIFSGARAKTIQLTKISKKILFSKIDLPRFKLPTVALPKIILPKLTIPTLRLPHILLSKLSLPKLPSFSLQKPQKSCPSEAIDIYGVRQSLIRLYQKSRRKPLLATGLFAPLRMTYKNVIALLRFPTHKFPSFRLSRLKLPKFTLPKLKLPSFKFPAFTLPKVALPSFSLPSLKMPRIKLPTFVSPKFTLPKFTLSSLSFPQFAIWKKKSSKKTDQALSGSSSYITNISTRTSPITPGDSYWKNVFKQKRRFTLLRSITSFFDILLTPVRLPTLKFPSFTLLKTKPPSFSFPKFALPKLKLPSLKLPTLSLPTFTFPKVSLPSLKFPHVRLPKIILPKFSLPSLSFPWKRESIHYRGCHAKPRPTLADGDDNVQQVSSAIPDAAYWKHIFIQKEKLTSRIEKIQRIFSAWKNSAACIIHTFTLPPQVQNFLLHSRRILSTYFKKSSEQQKGQPSRFFLWKKDQVTQILLLLLVVGTVGVFFVTLASTTNRTKPITYQGRLLDTNYVPVADTTYNMKFRIYDALTGGNCKWATGTDTNSANCTNPGALSVSVARGLFSVNLGDNTTGNIWFPYDFSDATPYLEITINNETTTPRRILSAVPYALNSEELQGWNPTAGVSGGITLIGGTAATDTLTLQGTAHTSATAASSSIVFKVGNNGATTAMTILNSGNIGIGTTAPSYKLDIATSAASDRGINIAHTATTGTNYGIYSSVTGAATANVGGYFAATGASTSRGLEVAALTSATSTGLTIGTLSAATSSVGIQIGALSGAGTATGIDIGAFTNTGSTQYGITIGAFSGTHNSGTTAGINIGNISSDGSTTSNYGLKLGTLTGGTDANYQISTGAITSATTTANAQLNLGGVVTTGGTTNYGITIGELSGSGTTNYGLNITTLTSTGTTSGGINIGGLSGAATTNYGINIGNLSGGTTSKGIAIGTNSSATATGLDIGALSGGTANIGVKIGALSGSGTATGIDIGNISNTGTTNYGIKLGTMTGGTTSNYGITIGALSGGGTTNYGINIDASSATGTTNYGMKIGALSGAATTNYGLYIDSVSGATSNYGLIVAGGNVGIGTVTPSYQIDVASSTTGTLDILRLQNNVAAAVSSGSQILFAANRTTGGITNIAGISGIITDIGNAAAAGALLFSTATAAGSPAERMRIDNSGNVGIGVTAPQTLLHLQNTTAKFGVMMGNTSYTSATSTAVIGLNYAANDWATTSSASDLILMSKAGQAMGFAVSNLSTTAQYVAMTLTANAHIEYSATTTPSVSSCGTSPSITGTDMAGRVVIGSNVATCTVTFINSWANAPLCWANNETTANLARASATATVLTISGTLTANDNITYGCVGWK